MTPVVFPRFFGESVSPVGIISPVCHFPDSGVHMIRMEGGSAKTLCTSATNVRTVNDGKKVVKGLSIAYRKEVSR
jgi:hypothetical protein